MTLLDKYAAFKAINVLVDLGVKEGLLTPKAKEAITGALLLPKASPRPTRKRKC